MDKEVSSAKVGGGLCQWTPTQSTFVLTFLSNIIAEGTKTTIGFKKVHLNACAKALNDHSLWDENEFIVSLDHEHYKEHMVV
jgi:hypothetical protein